MIDRSTLCEEICRLAGTNRMNPTRKLLDKREMECIFATLSRQRIRIEQLESLVKKLQRDRTEHGDQAHQA